MDFQQVLTDDDILAMDGAPRPRAAPQPIIPRQAPLQAPSQDAASRASAAASAANANRTGALTPAEVEQARLQVQAAQRDLSQGASPQQVNQNELGRYRADIEALTTQLQHVGDLYNRNFRDNDPMVTLGMSPTEREFDSAAAQLRQQAQGAFRIPGSGDMNQTEVQQMSAAFGLDSRNWDQTNEELLTGITNRLNERRRALGMEPVDWRQPAAPNPALVQPGESMGRVGNLPPLVDSERSQGSGTNQLDNAGGLYETSEDRQRAEQIAGHLTAMGRQGATVEQINQYLASQRLQPLPPGDARIIESYRRHPRDFPGFSPNVIPTGRSDPNLTTGAANSDAGAYVIGAGDALTFGLLDNATSDPERTRAGMEMLREEHPIASAVGEATGSLVPGVGIERGLAYGMRLLNDVRGASSVARLGNEARTIGEIAQRPLSNALYGGAYGAGSADQNGGGFMERLGAAGRGAALSAAGGEVGDRVVAGAGRALTGVRNEGVRYLSERGVPLSIGAIASRGGPISRSLTTVENALESVPLLGNAIRARRMDSFQGVNRAAFDDTVAPISGTVTNTGEQGVEQVNTAVRGAYDDALNAVRVSADDDFATEMQAAMGLGAALPNDLRGHFNNFVENRLAAEMVDGELTGAGYQALRQELREDRAAVKGQLGARRYTTALSRLEGALERLVRRQAPDAVPALNAADQAYRRGRVVSGAVGRAINNKEEAGLFTPAQLGTEARANARRFGGDEATTNRPFFELQRNSQEIIPSTVPNSGTTDRAWVLSAFPALASGTAYQTGLIDADTAALFAGLGLPYTRRGQQLFQKMLVNRPERVRQLGEAILARRGAGARVGAGAINPITDQTPSPRP